MVLRLRSSFASARWPVFAHSYITIHAAWPFRASWSRAFWYLHGLLLPHSLPPRSCLRRIQTFSCRCRSPRPCPQGPFSVGCCLQLTAVASVCTRPRPPDSTPASPCRLMPLHWGRPCSEDMYTLKWAQPSACLTGIETTAGHSGEAAATGTAKAQLQLRPPPLRPPRLIMSFPQLLEQCPLIWI